GGAGAGPPPPAWGRQNGGRARPRGTSVRGARTDATLVWAGVALTMASTDTAPIASATVGTAGWTLDPKQFAAWSTSTGPSSSPSGTTSATTGTVKVRG
ncbi:MAG: hypothetical protein L0L73_05050, partial [Acidipropionibacterium jensenii]|nr:hypothetical protein [Acidipropionibacterium jensenii]